MGGVPVQAENVGSVGEGVKVVELGGVATNIEAPDVDGLDDLTSVGVQKGEDVAIVSIEQVAVAIRERAEHLTVVAGHGPGDRDLGDLLGGHVDNVQVSLLLHGVHDGIVVHGSIRRGSIWTLARIVDVLAPDGGCTVGGWVKN